MARLRLNNTAGTAAGNPITFSNGSTTTGTWNSDPGFATLSGSDYYVVIVEPGTANEEIVYLTAYTAHATTGTFTRAQESTAGIAHAATAWTHGPTAADFENPATTVTGPDAVGAAKAVGTATTYAREDHDHGQLSSGTPGSSAVGDSASAGSAATISLSDHRHGRETFATNTIALGTSAAAGSSAHPMRADDTIAAFDGTAPVTQAFGDAAATGSAAVAAHRDHKHGMPANPVTAGAVEGLFTADQQIFSGTGNGSGEIIDLWTALQEYFTADNQVLAGTGNGAGEIINLLSLIYEQFSAAGQIVVGTGSATGQRLAIGSAGTVLQVGGGGASGIQWASSGTYNGVYGDGSDGSATMDGSTVVAGMTPSGNVYTAARDYYFTDLTINNGVTFAMAGFRVSGTGTLTGPGSGTAYIANNGNNASGVSAGGATPTTGSVAGNGKAGGNGGASAVGNNGASVASNSLGGAGGHGGQGNANNGGTAGTTTAPTAALGYPRAIPMALLGQGFGGTANYFGGSGGGGGGGNSGSGGGGGGGGGLVCVYFRQFATNAGTLTLSATGGNGANGVSGNSGGGAGGGGGAIICITQSVTPGGSLPGGVTTSVAGGSNGSVAGSGTNTGITSAGSGNVYLVPG